MSKQAKYLYPIKQEVIRQYARSIFTPLAKGECVTTIWVTMAGRRMRNKFIIENIDLFKKELPNYLKYLLVYVEPMELTEESLAGYLRLMGKGLIDACQKNREYSKGLDIERYLGIFGDETATYSKLLETIKSLLKETLGRNFEVVFFLGEFDELNKFANRVFYNNLTALWDLFKPKLHYVFLSVADLTTPEITEDFGEINAATLQNVIYVPIHSNDNVDYLIEFNGERLSRCFNDKEKELIKKICGGHPYLIKAACRILANFIDEKTRVEDLEQILLTHYEMLSAARRIFSARTEREKVILKKIALGGVVSQSEDLGRLVNLGLVIEQEKGKYLVFGKLFKTVAQRWGEITRPELDNLTRELRIDEKEGTVCCGGVPIEEKFTAQEYNVIKFFLENPGKLKTRDEISQILWGEESYEKYSDWAIDQVISKIRKKLGQLDAKNKLVTLRGRGYKLI